MKEWWVERAANPLYVRKNCETVVWEKRHNSDVIWFTYEGECYVGFFGIPRLWQTVHLVERDEAVVTYGRALWELGR